MVAFSRCPLTLRNPTVGPGTTQYLLYYLSNAHHVNLVYQVVIVPGYGLAVAGAQYAIAETVKVLTKHGIKVMEFLSTWMKPSERCGNEAFVSRVL